MQVNKMFEHIFDTIDKPTLCHSRVGGNPCQKIIISDILDSRFRGNDTE